MQIRTKNEWFHWNRGFERERESLAEAGSCGALEPLEDMQNSCKRQLYYWMLLWISKDTGRTVCHAFKLALQVTVVIITSPKPCLAIYVRYKGNKKRGEDGRRTITFVRFALFVAFIRLPNSLYLSRGIKVSPVHVLTVLRIASRGCRLHYQNTRLLGKEKENALPTFSNW